MLKNHRKIVPQFPKMNPVTLCLLGVVACAYGMAAPFDEHGHVRSGDSCKTQEETDAFNAAGNSYTIRYYPCQPGHVCLEGRCVAVARNIGGPESNMFLPKRPGSFQLVGGSRIQVTGNGKEDFISLPGMGGFQIRHEPQVSPPREVIVEQPEHQLTFEHIPSQPHQHETQITKEFRIPQPIHITREFQVPEEVHITREFQVPQEVHITREFQVPQEVHITREFQVPQEVQITRELRPQVQQITREFRVPQEVQITRELRPQEQQITREFRVPQEVQITRELRPQVQQITREFQVPQEVHITRELRPQEQQITREFRVPQEVHITREIRPQEQQITREFRVPQEVHITREIRTQEPQITREWRVQENKGGDVSLDNIVLPHSTFERRFEGPELLLAN